MILIFEQTHTHTHLLGRTVKQVLKKKPFIAILIIQLPLPETDKNNSKISSQCTINDNNKKSTKKNNNVFLYIIYIESVTCVDRSVQCELLNYIIAAHWLFIIIASERVINCWIPFIALRIYKYKRMLVLRRRIRIARFAIAI